MSPLYLNKKIYIYIYILYGIRIVQRKMKRHIFQMPPFPWEIPYLEPPFHMHSRNVVPSCWIAKASARSDVSMPHLRRICSGIRCTTKKGDKCSLSKNTCNRMQPCDGFISVQQNSSKFGDQSQSITNYRFGALLKAGLARPSAIHLDAFEAGVQNPTRPLVAGMILW